MFKKPENTCSQRFCNEVIPHYDDTIYNEPYIVKDGCLYEQVPVKDQLVDVKLADFVPVLKETVYSQTGWQNINGELVFLMPQENIEYTVELQGKLTASKSSFINVLLIRSHT